MVDPAVFGYAREHATGTQDSGPGSTANCCSSESDSLSFQHVGGNYAKTFEKQWNCRVG